jgi:hypothetical protein
LYNFVIFDPQKRLAQSEEQPIHACSPNGTEEALPEFTPIPPARRRGTFDDDRRSSVEGVDELRLG